MEQTACFAQRSYFAFCLIAAVTAGVLALSGCSPRCPDGSGVLKGKCVPVQQGAGSGSTAEQTFPDTANSEGGQSAPAVSGTSTSEPRTVNTGTAGAGGAATSTAGAAVSTAGAAANDDQASGEPPAVDCMPSDELCDNLDNDCDGRIDEGVTRACQDLPAPCQAGVLACRAGVWDDEATQCEGAIGPSEEVCDEGMVDENCDGVVNEGCACNDGETKECGRSEGVCRPGTQTCSGGMWPTECEGAIGNPDEGCECTNGTTEPCNAGRGVCAMGERRCERGMWAPCTSLERSSPEVCDNLDNDCNGIIDGPTATCPNRDEKCVAPGRCAQCTTDRDCSSLTRGCEIGKCQSGNCEAEPLEQYAACTGGYCVDNECSAPRKQTIQNTDPIVQYKGGGWGTAGDVHYSNSPGASFEVPFIGTHARIFGGKNADRGITEYSICDGNGSNCSSPTRVDQYAMALMHRVNLWTSPRRSFGEHLIRGRATGQMTGSRTDIIIDLDYVEVNP